jgi:DNA-binding NtrC family response regulator
MLLELSDLGFGAIDEESVAIAHLVDGVRTVLGRGRKRRAPVGARGCARRSGGYEVETAADGAQVVEMLDSAAEMPALVVLDLLLPRVRGIEVIRAHDLDVPVILMTGAPAVETAIEAVSLGALQYLPKPTPGDELAKAVHRASLHRMATMKRESLALGGEGTQVGDRAGLEARFEHALETM